jgi:hypothetical protein
LAEDRRKPWVQAAVRSLVQDGIDSIRVFLTEEELGRLETLKAAASS